MNCRNRTLPDQPLAFTRLAHESFHVMRWLEPGHSHPRHLTQHVATNKCCGEPNRSRPDFEPHAMSRTVVTADARARDGRERATSLLRVDAESRNRGTDHLV